MLGLPLHLKSCQQTNVQEKTTNSEQNILLYFLSYMYLLGLISAVENTETFVFSFQTYRKDKALVSQTVTPVQFSGFFSENG